MPHCLRYNERAKSLFMFTKFPLYYLRRQSSSYFYLYLYIQSTYYTHTCLHIKVSNISADLYGKMMKKSRKNEHEKDEMAGQMRMSSNSGCAIAVLNAYNST